ncbi:glycosyltransferase family 39 protein [Aggregatilinea lenta]|uniref:glycosyltransferase family 39 protein n=1 Tax=Aggregatilinea lenta TaxID=913108 RepID=UPI000E5B537F|nr:glycosyltransferase family 39 protein [Aggregatilinea lenta]
MSSPGVAVEPRSGNRGVWVAVMTAVLLFGFVLLVHDLDKLSLWSDEAWTITATAGSPGALVNDWLATDFHPPLFFAELMAWRQVASESIFALRYLSVLILLVGLALVYRLGRDLFSPPAGVLAALWFGLHDLVLIFGQEVRHYPQQLTLTVLAIWVYWRFWRRPTRGRGIALAVGGAALLLTHYWGGFVLLALGLHALITRRRALLPFVWAFGGMALLFAPWLPVLLKQIDAQGAGIPQALPNTWTGYKTLAIQLVGTPEALWSVLVAAGAAGSLAALRRLRPRPSMASAVPLGVLVIGVGVSLGLNLAYPTLSPRAVAVVIPALALLIGHALAQFHTPERALLAAVVVIQGMTTTAVFPPVHPPWPEVSAFVAQHAAGDLVLLEMNNHDLNRMEEVTMDYYLKAADPAIRRFSSEGARLADPVGFREALAAQVADETGLWVVKLGWIYYDVRPDLEALGFVATAPAITFEPFIGYPVELWRYDRPPQASPRAVFGDVLALNRADIAARDGSVTVNLLWTAASVPEREITVSAFLLGADGALVVQHDSYPLEGRSPTSTWTPDALAFDSHTLDTSELPPGTYTVGLKVYTFDATFTFVDILPPDPCDDAACEFVTLGTVEVGE